MQVERGGARKWRRWFARSWTRENENSINRFQVKRAVDDYHKSVNDLGFEVGGTLNKYQLREYTFKNFELFLYETLKSLQKPGTFNFQNISEVYREVFVVRKGNIIFSIQNSKALQWCVEQRLESKCKLNLNSF